MSTDALSLDPLFLLSPSRMRTVCQLFNPKRLASILPHIICQFRGTDTLPRLATFSVDMTVDTRITVEHDIPEAVPSVCLIDVKYNDVPVALWLTVDGSTTPLTPLPTLWPFEAWEKLCEVVGQRIVSAPLWLPINIPFVARDEAQCSCNVFVILGGPPNVCKLFVFLQQLEIEFTASVKTVEPNDTIVELAKDMLTLFKVARDKPHMWCMVIDVITYVAQGDAQRAAEISSNVRQLSTRFRGIVLGDEKESHVGGGRHTSAHPDGGFHQRGVGAAEGCTGVAADVPHP